MKIKKPQKNNRPIVLTIALVSIVLLIALATWWYLSQQTGNTAQNQETLSVKDKGINEVDYSPAKPEDSTPQTTEQSSPSSPSSPGQTTPIPMIITAANKNGSTLQVRTLVQELLSEGSCKISLDGPSLIEQTAEVFTASSSTTCRGFDIDTSGLAPGSYLLTITITSGQRTGSASQEIIL